MSNSLQFSCDQAAQKSAVLIRKICRAYIWAKVREIMSCRLMLKSQP